MGKKTAEAEPQETAEPVEETPVAEPAEAGTGLMPVTQAARDMFTARQVGALKRTVFRNLAEDKLVTALEVAARYNLNPWTGEIYAADMNGAMVIMIGRDGYLAHASRQEAFSGVVSDVVHKNDVFKVTWQTSEKGAFPNVHHEYPEDRGEVIGAWAVVYRTDRSPTYFYAPLDEYKKGGGPWAKQKSAMIVKCAQSTALRIAFNISGAIPGDEVGGRREIATNGEVEGNELDPTTFNWGEDHDLVERLQDLFRRCNEAVPNAFKKAKIRAMLADKSDLELVEVAEGLEAWLADHGVVDAEAEAVEDAEVVE